MTTSRSSRRRFERHRAPSSAGFGLIEVVIALALLMLIVLPMSYLLGTVLQQTGNARASVAAGLLAEQQLEEAHSILSSAMTAPGTTSVCTPTGGTGPVLPCTIPQPGKTVQGFNYHINLYFDWYISGSTDVCTSGRVPQVVLAQVTVSWGPTLKSVSESSIVNLPYIATNPNNGFLAVQVDNASGGGTQGVTVTAATTSPAYSTVGVTDSAGCAFLTIPSASSPGYTVSLSPPASAAGATYVDQVNNPAPLKSNEAVAPQGITSVSFNYDRAASINLQYPSVTGVADGITCPTPTFCLASGQQQQQTTAYSMTSKTFADHTGADPGTGVGGLTYQANGPLGGTSVGFDGSSGYVQTANPVTNPQTFSLAAWFKTTGSGSIIGFTNSQGTSATSWDRQIWVDGTGHVVFGVYNNTTSEIQSTGTYNDGNWHFVVATLSPSDGMNLYVDGAPVASNSTVTSAQAYNGYWHLGWSNAGTGWPNPPTPASGYFPGSLAQVAVFPTALSASQVSQLDAQSASTGFANQVITDSPTSYWPLDQFSTAGLANGQSTAEVLETTNGTSWTNVPIPHLSRLLDIACPTTTVCEGVGTGTSGTGVAFGAAISGGSWTITPQALPAGSTVSDLSTVACASATQCYSAGYGITGTTRSAVMLSYNGTTWSSVTVTPAADQINSIACPTTSTCIVDANNTATPVPAPALFTFNTATSAFTPAPALSPAPSALGTITCGASTAGLCIVDGTASGAGEAYVSPDNGTTWTAVGAMPAGLPATLGAPVCTSTTSCLITDNRPGATPPAQMLDLTSTTSGSTTTWTAVAASLPAGVQSLTGLACSSATNCVASGQITVPGSPAEGTILTSTDSGGTWTSRVLPGNTTPTFLSGIGCAGSTCVAAGESSTSDLLYGRSDGSWQSETVPAQPGATGVLGAGWSASVGNTNLPLTFLEVAPPAPSPVSVSSLNPAALFPLYPFNSGYSVWPGGCAAETVSPPATTASPGGSSTVTVSLASVALEVVDGTGQPVPGATITMTESNPTTSHCPAETYAMPTTNADGLSRAGFSYGSYTVTITNPLSGAVTTKTVEVSATSLSLAIGATTPPTFSTYPEPDLLVVQIS
ncbi:MAG: LamG-like jellyroll fold domain-containing protein [Acidimicrobiales bacterium]